MKKPSVSLKSVNIIFFVILVSFVALIGIEQYRYIKREFMTELQKRIETNTYQLQDYFKNSFDRLHHVFNKTSQLDFQKLQEVKEYFDTIDKPLEPIHKRLNENVIFGTYDIYLIGPDKVIVRSTFPMDVGMDFKNYEYASRIFDMVRNGVIPYHLSTPYFSSVSNDFRRYLLTLSKHGDFFVQISHNYFPLENVRNEVLLLKERYPHLKTLEVIFSSNDLIKRLDRVYLDKKDFFKKHEKEKEDLLRQFAKDLHLDLNISGAMREKNLIELLFGKERIRYRIDPASKTAAVYSLSENIFNDSVNREIIILRSIYDLHGFYAGYHTRLTRLGVIMALSFLMILAIFFFVKRLFSDQLVQMAGALKHDHDIETGDCVVKEFKMVSDAINNYREKLKRKNRELEMLSHTDPLTGVYNRRYFGKMLEEYIYEYRRYGRRFALLVFDIDNFKQINDEYGHDVGDEVLREITNVIAHEIRMSDLLFRIGGEEFAILFEPIDPSHAEKIATGLCESVRKHRFLNRFHVTISIGVSCFREDDDTFSLYKRVDSYTYRSKKSGKDRVTADEKETDE